MKMSTDLIKDNHHLLKVCILYEVRRKKPVFDSDRNFCKTVGQDVMEYTDFEFWYYRFHHGQADFDYDRSADPEPKTLVDMPVVLMTKIAGYLDPVERTHLRSMNHAIKAVADTFPPVFEKIDSTIMDTSLYWNLNNKNFSCYKQSSGCKLYKPNSSKTEESEECHIKKSLEYLAPVLKMPNIQVNHLSLHLSDETLNRDDLLPVPFNAKSVHIYGRNANKVIQFLSSMTPGHLESISIDGSFFERREDFRLIFETDQFKQAKSIKLKSSWISFTVADLANFSHLKSFKCELRSENAFEDVPRIQDIISTFEEFESCELAFLGGLDGFPIGQFAGALGEQIPEGPLKEGEHLSITHRYRIPESNQYLEFKVKDGGYRCMVNIVKVR
ncbi:hypothetical protein B9Z55_027037 [Caenorhabditis nigoni]|uniref:F-box domain-containing protein n=2 Tax=Caenorhabditis nigoni TaxID=1611254 RepID=A0A2G5SJ32_9PELO|nr:hypothetical protein B9Z55_027037 [Caenorhabditis nigoni]